ncbi:YfbM family protein [Brachyspira murdochii]|uniref:YfbM family protein n=1 Tax=Brachyspira murdochii TaxID=84378 RepID=UPI0012F529EF|nr:YfbM family protein [Brachyspira murdochii]
MGCLGVLFALSDKDLNKLLKTSRLERPDFVCEYLEEIYFEKHKKYIYELDKSWDAMHRCLSNDGLLVFGDDNYPLGSVIMGSDVLYGNGDEEEDYIITLKKANVVKDIAQKIETITKEKFKEKYLKIDEKDYEYILSDEDFEYTWDYFYRSIEFWKNASESNRAAIFTADQ